MIRRTRPSERLVASLEVQIVYSEVGETEAVMKKTKNVYSILRNLVFILGARCYQT